MELKIKVERSKDDLGSTPIGEIDGFILDDDGIVLVTGNAVIQIYDGEICQAMENPMIPEATIDELQDEALNFTRKVIRVLRKVRLTIEEI